MKIEIRIAELGDIPDIVDHDIRHKDEPGFNGTLAHPFLPEHPWDAEEMRNNMLVSFSKDITEEGWQRAFVIEADGKILGTLNLKNLFYGTLHRTQLGMGLEAPLRGQGLGKKLLDSAINWAKSQPTLEWIDLSVFAHNTPARKLYSNAGFIEQTVWKDRLRVGHHRIDDVLMTLKLK
jgi:RimJ/RimL family protein N-acetyltransferase